MPQIPPPAEAHPPRLADIANETPVEQRYPRTSRRRAAQSTWLKRGLIGFVAVHAAFGAKELIWDRALGHDRPAALLTAAAPQPQVTVTEAAPAPTETVTEWVAPEPVILRRPADQPNPPPATPPRPSQARQIVVAQGDTLTGLAATHLGSARRWPEIADLNRVDPRLLQPGVTLTLPDR